MAKVTLGSTNYVNLSKLKPGDLIADGVYMGAKRGGNFNNLTHFIRPKSGGSMIGFSCTQMNKVVENFGLKTGIELKITYAGKGKEKIMGHFPHGINVEVDADALENVPLTDGDEVDVEEAVEEEKPAPKKKKTTKKKLTVDPDDGIEVVADDDMDIDLGDLA